MKDELIKLVLEYGIIKTNFKQPITFKSGIKSPIYCNFRECSSHNDLMRLIRDLFKEMFATTWIQGIVGVAVGGVSHATILGDAMNLPSGFIRPGAQKKEYGLGNVIEGLDVTDKRILLIEDLVSTGDSVLSNARILKDAGAEVIIASIFTYRMKQAEKEFAEAGYKLHSLLDVNDILPAMREKLITKSAFESLMDWVSDPAGWFDRHKLEFEFGFLTTLRKSTNETNSIICMGLDPVIEALPKEYAEIGIHGAGRFLALVVQEMRNQDVLPGMFKPNEGFYTKYNKKIGEISPGSNALHDLVFTLPGIINVPKLIDAKRGDIGKSSENYAEQYFGGDFQPWQAVTVSPFMGTDSVLPFGEHCNSLQAKGVYILNKTSNPGSKDFQMAKLSDGRYMYQLVSDKIVEWAKGRPGIGAVIGGTSLDELRTILKFFAKKDIPVLVPGVGSQGGSAKDVANVAREVGFDLDLLRINSSSGVTHPWYKKAGDPIPGLNECVEMCVTALKTLNNEVGYTVAV